MVESRRKHLLARACDIIRPKFVGFIVCPTGPDSVPKHLISSPADCHSAPYRINVHCIQGWFLFQGAIGSQIQLCCIFISYMRSANHNAEIPSPQGQPSRTVNISGMAVISEKTRTHLPLPLLRHLQFISARGLDHTLICLLLLLDINLLV